MLSCEPKCASISAEGAQVALTEVDDADQLTKFESSMVSSRPAVTSARACSMLSSSEVALNGPVGREKQEGDARDRLRGRGRDGERVARALEAVALDTAVELVGVARRRGLVVDDDETVGTAVQQVDVALEQAAVDGRARIDLAPLRRRGGLDHRR